MKPYGTIVVGALIALGAVGTALGAVYWERRTPSALPETASWRTAFDAIAGSVEGRRAPAEFRTSEAIALEFAEAYRTLETEGRLDTPEATEVVREIVARNVVTVDSKETYTPSSFKTGNDIGAYLETVGATLGYSTAVQQYELVVFAEAVGRNDFNGSPKLAAAASVYRKIEADLVKISVPTELLQEHAALTNSMAFLAQTTEYLAEWTGDPVDALAFVDAFIRAEQSFEKSFSTLVARAEALLNA